MSIFLGKVNKSTYKELIKGQIDLCKSISERVSGKVNYLQRQLLGDSNSDWTDGITFSIDKVNLKSQKLSKLGEQIDF